MLLGRDVVLKPITGKPGATACLVVLKLTATANFSLNTRSMLLCVQASDMAMNTSKGLQQHPDQANNP